ncbi:TetR/AcrR family transcriptional regulator [Leifsonia shinshuensis]|uniref:AcrR family transcriptional regulator n=1 Tax=Leifsonia shinshuensis TaxID=150026 RepID=A0A853D481_9MICO|nr:TetR/AcrR family transcriptional regulator [Leifsonia shinshuensis]NYJ25810.1 AcrR family transcriptional regulator [Leifsonia shinshuensis]
MASEPSAATAPPQKATRRGSYAVGRARREQILDIATERFAQSGYSATSLARIAQDVGLTTPGLMHHFPSKQHLLLAVAERRFDLAGQLAFNAPADTDGLGPLRLMLRLAAMFQSQPGLMELFVLLSAEAADPDSPAHELYAARYERVIGELESLFHTSVEAGHLRRDVDYRAVARECIALADGLQLQWVLSRGGIDLVALTKSNLERLAPTILVSGAHVDLTV